MAIERDDMYAVSCMAALYIRDTTGKINVNQTDRVTRSHAFQDLESDMCSNRLATIIYTKASNKERPRHQCVASTATRNTQD